MSDNPTKQCTKCKEIKELSEFGNKKSSKDKLQYSCRLCKKEYTLKYCNIPANPVGDNKACTGCKIIKNISDFHKNKHGKDGFSPKCKTCIKKYQKLYMNKPLDPISSEKMCTGCKLIKPIVQFNKSRYGKDGLRTECQECSKTKKLEALYDISPQDYERMLCDQGGVCAICKRSQSENTSHRLTGKPALLSVDHCHKTLKVRGLLCGPCNMAIGLLRDNPENAESAASYLRSAGFVKQKRL